MANTLPATLGTYVWHRARTQGYRAGRGEYAPEAAMPYEARLAASRRVDWPGNHLRQRRNRCALDGPESRQQGAGGAEWIDRSSSHLYDTPGVAAHLER